MLESNLDHDGKLMTKKTPVLSILLPTYNYKDGVLRILNRIEALLCHEVEIIIGDNSSNQSIKEAVNPFLDAFSSQIFYQWNNPTKSPIENWNWLVNTAKGEYLMMIHHDEFPENEKTILEILNKLHDDPSIDAILLNCHLVYKKKRFTVKHFNTKLRDFLIRNNPNYLYRRNLIGPTAIVVARKSLYPLFDESLIWLVDVDIYARLFQKGIKWISCSGIIYSEQERSDSLTGGLGSSIAAKRTSELQYLRDRESTKDLWFGSYESEPIQNKCFRMLEALIWYSYRAFTRGLARVRFWSHRAK